MKRLAYSLPRRRRTKGAKPLKFVQVPTRKQSPLAVKEKQPFGRCNLPSGLLYENNMYIRAISRDTMEVLSFAKAYYLHVSITSKYYSLGISKLNFRLVEKLFSS